jgi:hypothetical protein
MADILAFPERCADAERKALIVKARADYDSIFPAETTTSILPDAQERNRLRLNSIHRRDNFKFRTPTEPTRNDNADELLMDHADPSCLPCDVAYHAPDSDPA